MIYRISQMPPSVNQMYEVNFRAGRGKKDRRRSDAYNDWIALAFKELLPVTPLSCEKYELHLHLPKNMRGDLDGRAKALIDILVKVGATPDDKHLQKLLMTKSTDNGVVIEVIGLN